MYQTALLILKKLESLGYESYIIGGYVRDKLLNIKNSDIDICTSATPDIIKKQFNIINDHSKFGSMVIKENSFLFEITTFRKDIYTKNRYPKVIYVSSLIEDLSRRDFTINTLCINKEGKLIDLINAVEDLKRKELCSIGNPTLKLKEDPIRILRAIRFSCQLNFSINRSLSKAIYSCKNNLYKINKNSIKKEYLKILKLNNGKNLLKKYKLDHILFSMFNDIIIKGDINDD